MKIIIIGTGEVGAFLSEHISQKKHDVTIIEQDEKRCSEINELCNAKVICGNGSSAETLGKAGATECDFLLAMTDDDRTNIIACSLAKALGTQNTISRAHDQTYSDTSYVNYQLHFGIDYIVTPEALCAVELAKLIRNPDRISVENFARGEIEVQQVHIHSGSKLIGIELQNLKLDPKIRIAYILRDGEIEIPQADTVLKESDQATVVGPSDSIGKFLELLNPKSAIDNSRIVLFGGTEISIALIRLLKSPRFKIRIIEKDKKVCEELAQRFPEVTIINGDATSLRVLEEEQVENCDFFIGCSKDDEDNIMTVLQARHLGAKRTGIIINKPDYENILNNLQETLGLDMIVSPRLATTKEVIRFLNVDPYIELSTLSDNKGKIIEMRVPDNSSCAGKKIKDLGLPPATVIVAQMHKFQAQVPTAEDTILGADRLVIVTKEDQIKHLLELFA